MLKLFQFPAPPRLPNLSPACMRLEAYLRLAGIAYETRPADLEQAPKKKAPYVEIDGELMGDSEIIIRHLNARLGIDLDAGLDARERAVGHAVESMLAEHLYFALLHVRWLDDANWEIIKGIYFGDIPKAVREQVTGEIREGVRRKLIEHGLGVHSHDEILALAAADLDALAALLGERPFMLGEHPRAVDCSAHAYVANLLLSPFETPLEAATRTHANLVAYSLRMMERVFPEVLEASA